MKSFSTGSTNMQWFWSKSQHPTRPPPKLQKKRHCLVQIINCIFRRSTLTKMGLLHSQFHLESSPSFCGGHGQAVLSVYPPVSLRLCGNLIQEAPILFQHIILPQVSVLFVELRSVFLTWSDGASRAPLFPKGPYFRDRVPIGTF